MAREENQNIDRVPTIEAPHFCGVSRPHERRIEKRAIHSLASVAAGSVNTNESTRVAYFVPEQAHAKFFKTTVLAAP